MMNELYVASKHGGCQNMILLHIWSSAVTNVSASASNAKDVYSDR